MSSQSEVATDGNTGAAPPFTGHDRCSAKKSPNERPLGLIIIILVCVVVLFALFALCIGRFQVPFDTTVDIVIGIFAPIDQTWTTMQANVIVNSRLPRILAAILVGAALAVAGSSYQSIFKNPLVSPDLLGVSSGACIGAALSILWGLPAGGTQAAAFIGGIAAVAATMSIPRLLHRESTMTLVLSGIIIGGFCSAVLGIIKYLADPETQLPDIVYWQMGSLAKVSYSTLAVIAPVIIVSLIIILALRWRINVLAMGDREAKSLGINLKFERGLVILFSTLLTASSVCLAGTIGWVGLVLPHLARFVVGPNTARSIPVAGVMAAAFMLLVDTLARASGIEIPLGIITGLIGTPFFIVLLAQQKNLL